MESRGAFADRIRLQLISRYHGANVEVDQARFALHVTGSGLDLILPLAPLFHACERQPDRVPVLIGEYVTSVEHQLTPRPAVALSTSRLLWCVRNDRFLGSHGRVGDLLRAPVGADLTAFVAEELPGSIMRGVPREEWASQGMSDEDVRRTASANTSSRWWDGSPGQTASLPTGGASRRIRCSRAACSWRRVSSRLSPNVPAARSCSACPTGAPSSRSPQACRLRTDFSAGCSRSGGKR